MRVLVCGGRDYENEQHVRRVLAIARGYGHLTVIEGGAAGADSFAARWADEHEDVGHEQYRAEWDRYGKRAGSLRNELMLRELTREGPPYLVAAFPSAASRGTWHMVRIARAADVPTVVYDSAGVVVAP